MLVDYFLSNAYTEVVFVYNSPLLNAVSLLELCSHNDRWGTNDTFKCEYDI